jgi:hypothetical protein
MEEFLDKCSDFTKNLKRSRGFLAPMGMASFGGVVRQQRYNGQRELLVTKKPNNNVWLS